MVRSAPTRRISRSCNARSNFACTRGRDFPDLVEEDRSAASDLEQSRLVADGTSKRSTHVAEQLGLEQRFRERRAIDAHEWSRGARALLVYQPDDEFLSGPTLAVHQHGRVERRHSGREFQHVLHRPAARDEMLCGRMTIDALAQQVQFSFTTFEQPFAPIELLQSFSDGLPQSLDLVTEARGLKIRANRFALRSPSVHIAPDGGAVTMALYAHVISRK